MTDQVTAPPSVLLREAARIMRERAKAATPGPWEAGRIGLMGGRVGLVITQPHGSFVMVDRDNEARIEDAKHIASWHPAVALAVADWLDYAAARAECKIANGGGEVPVWSHERDALSVARVYLGRTR